MPKDDDSKKKKTTDSHVNELILGGLKSRTGKDTTKWIAEMTDHGVRDAAEAAASEAEVSSGGIPTAKASRQAVVTLMDQMFDVFQQIEFDFNKSAAGTDLLVSIERPTYSTETVRHQYQAPEAVKVFRGRVSTRYWSLILRAHDEIVEGWAIPVEQVFGFRADDRRYEPYLTIESAPARGGEFKWLVNGQQIVASETRSLAKQIFGALIRVAQGVDAPEEKFRLSTGSEHSTSDHSIKALTGSESLYPQFDNDRLESSGSQRRILPTGSTPLQTLAKDELDSKPLRAACMDDVISMLKSLTNKELEQLSAQGAEAFAKQDMALVQKIYTRTQNIQALQAQMANVTKEWQKILEQE